MLTDKSLGFQKFIFDRIYHIRDEILNPDPEYQELGKIASELMDCLLAKLPPEDQKLLDRYDCERTNQVCRQDELLYSRGLMDGIILYHWLERIGRGEEKNIV